MNQFNAPTRMIKLVALQSVLSLAAATFILYGWGSQAMNAGRDAPSAFYAYTSQTCTAAGVGTPNGAERPRQFVIGPVMDGQPVSTLVPGLPGGWTLGADD